MSSDKKNNEHIEDNKNIKQDADVDPELGIAEENYNEFWKEKKEECEEEKENKSK